jgi:Rad3-related DNA helicase
MGRAAAAEVIKIVNATQGRAFVLSTSFAGMNDLYESASRANRLSLLCAGHASKAALC